MENLINEKDCFELAEELYELAKDMDYNDHEETKEKEINDLVNALYQLKANAENKYNADYWRTLWNTLQML